MLWISQSLVKLQNLFGVLPPTSLNPLSSADDRKVATRFEENRFHFLNNLKLAMKVQSLNLHRGCDYQNFQN
jgi:hypothetical protein